MITRRRFMVLSLGAVSLTVAARKPKPRPPQTGLYSSTYTETY